jgi:hypothetical protein
LIAALLPFSETAYSSRGRRFQGWQEPLNLSLPLFSTNALLQSMSTAGFGAFEPSFSWFLLFSLF